MNLIENMKQIFLKIQKGKVNTHESMLLLIGLTFDLIQNKSIFKRNTDLKPFISVIYENVLGLSPYRDYLYNSRTLLGSRVAKDVSNCDFIKLQKIISELNIFFKLEEFEDYLQNINSSKEHDYLSEWINYIRGNND